MYVDMVSGRGLAHNVGEGGEENGVLLVGATRCATTVL